MRLERRKIKNNCVLETYAYENPELRTGFFEHLKVMRNKGYKNLRQEDRSDTQYFYATYEKNIEAKRK